MSKKKIGLNAARLITEILALVLAVFLFRKHKLQMWLVVFGIGVFISFFTGRLYCGWICPMNTIFRGINFIYGRLKIPRLKSPEFHLPVRTNSSNSFF